MAFDINELRKPANGGQWISDARICLSADGSIVDCESEEARTLLVGARSAIPAHVAESYGLVATEASTPKAKPIPTNKARKGAGTKSDSGAATPPQG